MERFHTLNELDNLLYEQASSYLDARLNAATNNRAFIKHNAKLLENGIVGWAFDPITDQPVQVKLIIDGIEMACKLATEFRPEIMNIGGARSGYVGFRFGRAAKMLHFVPLSNQKFAQSGANQPASASN